MGNGNQFTVKELLQAHINEDNLFKTEVRNEFNYMRTKFEKGTGKIAVNKTQIGAIKNGLMYGVGPVILFILGWLVKIQMNKP